jgi:hypothetical protein
MVYDRTTAFEQPLQSELEAQPLAYVLPEELRQTLLSAGLPEEKIPGASNLEQLLRSLEVRVDEWMGYRLAPTRYIKERPCQTNGILHLEYYPVLDVISVKRVVAGFLGTASPKPQLWDVPTLWEGGRNIKVPSQGRDRYRVEYLAGYDPIPPIVKETLLNLLKAFFVNYQGDPAIASPADLLAHLNTLTRDLTQVNLPGGISQTFRVGDPSGGGKSGGGKGGDGGTELDRALLPLQKLKLRRQVIT